MNSEMAYRMNADFNKRHEVSTCSSRVWEYTQSTSQSVSQNATAFTTQQIDLLPIVWPHSSVGRALHWHRRGHGFEFL